VLTLTAPRQAGVVCSGWCCTASRAAALGGQRQAGSCRAAGRFVSTSAGCLISLVFKKMNAIE